MRRKIVGISGQFALADDGSCWMWTDTGWKPWGRGELPEAQGLDYFANLAAQSNSGPPWPTTMATGEVVVAPIKRGPGRPRKVQP